MMWHCKECKAVFEEPLYTRMFVDCPNLQITDIPTCPKCESIEIEQANMCEICNEYCEQAKSLCDECNGKAQELIDIAKERFDWDIDDVIFALDIMQE